MRGWGGRRGFTLVEMLIATAIVSLIMLAMAKTFLVADNAISNESNEIAADQALAQASLTLTRDLSSASSSSTGTISPGSGSLTVDYGSGPTVVTYTINSSDQLVRSVTGGNSNVAATGVKSLTIASNNPTCYLTVTIQPSAASAGSQALQVSRRPGGCY